MANVDNPNGATPVRHLSGGEIRTNEYSIASGYGTAIFEGDWVALTDADGRNLERAAAAATVVGVFAGCKYVDPSGEIKFSNQWPASQVATEIVAYVFDDPQLVFEMQIDNGTFNPDILGEIGNILATAGSTATGRSKEEIDLSTVGTTGTTHKVIGLAKNPSNAADDLARVEVIAALHTLANAAS